MAHLTLTGVSDDGKRLLLVSSDGVEFTIDIDPRLRAAVRGDQHRPPREQRPGHLENQMDSTLRPRDIQTRIRAGETPEAVAEAAQTTVDRIMAFAAPVMAERAHVADRAQRSSVRRRAGDPGSVGGARTLGEAVAGHLRSLNIDPDSVEWDAWRREDGRWTLSGEFAATKRSGSAAFTYDGPGNYVIADNDDAKWLIGESLPVAQSDEVRDDLRSARERRLTTVGEDELPLGADAIELVSEPAPQLVDDPLDAPAEPVEPAGPAAVATTSRRRGGQGEDRFGADQPLEAFLDVEPAPAEEAQLRDAAADAAALDDEGAVVSDAGQDSPEAVTGPEPEEPPAPRRPVRKSRGRASVPSWDEIMFGGGKND